MKVRKITYGSGRMEWQAFYRQRWRSYFPIPNSGNFISWLLLLPIVLVWSTFDFLKGDWYVAENAKDAFNFLRLMDVEKEKKIKAKLLKKNEAKQKASNNKIVKIERL